MSYDKLLIKASLQHILHGLGMASQFLIRLRPSQCLLLRNSTQTPILHPKYVLQCHGWHATFAKMFGRSTLKYCATKLTDSTFQGEVTTGFLHLGIFDTAYQRTVRCVGSKEWQHAKRKGTCLRSLAQQMSGVRWGWVGVTAWPCRQAAGQL